MKFGLIHQTALPAGKSECQAINQALEQIVAAESFGYEGSWMTEHHFSPYGMGSVETILSAAAAKTNRIRLGASVWVTPIHHPLRLAENVATLDIISSGRVNFGVGRGYGPLELMGFAIDPKKAREMHNECVDIVLGAWTAEEEFSYSGQFWQIPSVQVHPKPLQRPHPPIFQPLISPGSIDEAVRNGRNAIFGVRFSPIDSIQDTLVKWRAAQLAAGVKLNAVVNFSVYVDESEAAARSAIADPVMWLKQQFADLLPEDDRGIAVRDRLTRMDFNETFNTCLAGTPDTVAEQIRFLEEVGVEYLLCSMHFGSLPQENILRSMELFARKVIPQFC